MKAFEIKKNIYWVGAIDWDLRDFHGFNTDGGTTYNAYLIMDEKVVLVDSVRDYKKDEMLQRIKSIIDPSKIDIIISNHSEPDHSGSMQGLLDICPNAKVICSENGKNNLGHYFDTSKWDIQVVKSKDKINIGKRNLEFTMIQMVHWPDSMATYIEEDKILMPNDMFGQHIATNERFVKDFSFDIAFDEAKKYFANIFFPYSKSTFDALNEVDHLKIEMIAPSHGLIWTENISKIISSYKDWDSDKLKDKAVIIYDTMWGSTKKIAESIKDSFEEKNIPAEIKYLKVNQLADIMKDVLDAKYICVGSSALHNSIIPSVAGFLSYLKCLKPKNRVGLSFGSYGWGEHCIDEIDKVFKELDFKIMPSIKIQFRPKTALYRTKNFIHIDDSLFLKLSNLKISSIICLKIEND